MMGAIVIGGAVLLVLITGIVLERYLRRLMRNFQLLDKPPIQIHHWHRAEAPSASHRMPPIGSTHIPLSPLKPVVATYEKWGQLADWVDSLARVNPPKTDSPERAASSAHGAFYIDMPSDGVRYYRPGTKL